MSVESRSPLRARRRSNREPEHLDYSEPDFSSWAARLADYTPPTAAEIPPIELHHIESPAASSITGAKGLGEGGAIGAPAAVINAINDALAPFSVSIDEMPATPQRIRAALRAAQRH